MHQIFVPVLALSLVFAVQDPASKKAPAKPTPVFDGGLTCVMQVKDHEKAIAWYRDVLGFTVLYSIPEMGWCELTTPVGSVRVGLARMDAPRTGAGTVLTFGVADIEESKRRLEKSGARIEGVIETIPDLVKLLSFFDPDGNRLQLYQSLRAGKPGALAPVVFLAGSWRSGSGESFQEEHWTSPAGGAMVGMSRTVAGGRMKFFEHMRIEEKSGGVYYVVSPGGRPPVSFKMGETGANRVVFENPEHDFPTKITYWLDEEGSLRARIEGKADAKQKPQEFRWKRAGLVSGE